MSDTSTEVESLRRLGDDEEFSSSWTLREDGETVDCTFTIRADRDGPRYEKRCVVSFRDVTREQLIDLTRYDVVVKLQRRLRDMGAGMLVPSNYATVSVLDDIVNAERRVGPIDRKARAKRDLQHLGLSEARIAEILAELNGQN